MLLLPFVAACASGPSVFTIQVRGSDSEVNLVQRLGESWGDVARLSNDKGQITESADLLGQAPATTSEVAHVGAA